MAQKTVSAYRRRLGIQLSWHEARTSERFRQQQARRTRAFIEYTRQRWTEWRERKRHAWEKLKQELALRQDCPPPRVCEECGRAWFAAREFFHVRTRRSAGRVRVSFCRVCRLCRAGRRRERAAAHSTTSPLSGRAAAHAESQTAQLTTAGA
jgi:hypothetical protein